MPDLTGFEVLERLKSDPETATIPVIIHSSKVLSEEERSRLAARAVAIVPKGSPSREAALAALRNVLLKAGLDPTAWAKEAPRG